MRGGPHDSLDHQSMTAQHGCFEKTGNPAGLTGLGIAQSGYS
jgi:hypothetical protein